MQLLELQSDYKMKQFKYVLNTDKDFIRFRYIQNEFSKFRKKWDNQPSIKLFEQEVNSNKAQISLEKSKKNYQINRRCLLQTLNKRLSRQL
jgi:cobalt-zinc-cadmium resistance protein CzcA